MTENGIESEGDKLWGNERKLSSPQRRKALKNRAEGYGPMGRDGSPLLQCSRLALGFLGARHFSAIAELQVVHCD